MPACICGAPTLATTSSIADFDELKNRIGYHPRLIDRVRTTLRRNSDDFFIGGIEVLTVILIAAVLLPLIPNYSIFGGLTVAFLMLLFPATQGAVDLVNNTISSVFRPPASAEDRSHRRHSGRLHLDGRRSHAPAE